MLLGGYKQSDRMDSTQNDLFESTFIQDGLLQGQEFWDQFSDLVFIFVQLTIYICQRSQCKWDNRAVKKELSLRNFCEKFHDVGIKVLTEKT